MTEITIIDESKTLEASGGDDTLTESYTLNCDRIAVQAEVDGASTDFSFIIDVRLADDIDWALDWESLKNKDAPFSEVIRINAQAIREVRIRVVNNDTNNDVSSRIVARAWD